MAHARKVFKAQTRVEGILIFLGYYTTKEEADAARIRYRKRKGLIVDAQESRIATRKRNRALGLHQDQIERERGEGK